MPCTPKKTFEVALATHNHLLVQLKDNQPSLLEAVETLAAVTAPIDTATTVDKGRARQEKRTIEVFAVGEALAGTGWDHLLKTMIRVTRHTWMRNAATGLWDNRGEVAWYVTSASGPSAVAFGHIIRNHWGIENRNHHVRDVTYGEDKSRIRNNPGVFARARSFALNILRHNGVENVAHAIWQSALSLDVILAYKGLN